MECNIHKKLALRYQMCYMEILHGSSFDGNARPFVMGSTTSNCFWIDLKLRSTALHGLLPKSERHGAAVN